MDYTKPIQTQEQAKEFYSDFGCNGFYMSREYPERYREYTALNISRELEAEWRKEKMQQIFKLAVKNKRKDNGRLLQSYFEFSDEFTPDDVKKVYRLLRVSYRHISPRYNVALAETICNAGGLYPLGCLALTRKFEMKGWLEKYFRFVKKMLIFACTKDNTLLERSKRVLSPKENGTAELFKEIGDRIDTLKRSYIDESR